MSSNTKSLKNFLATASIIAVTANAGNAMAVTYTNATNADTTLDTGGNSVNLNNTVGNAEVKTYVNTADTNFQYSSPSRVNIASDITIDELDANGSDSLLKNVHFIDVAEGDLTLTSVVNNKAETEAYIDVVVRTDSQLLLAGNNMTALGGITLESQSNLTIQANGTTLQNPINGGGTITVNAGVDQFKLQGRAGTSGPDSSVGLLECGANSTTTISQGGWNNIAKVNLAANSQLTLGDGVHLAASTGIEGKGRLNLNGSIIDTLYIGTKHNPLDLIHIYGNAEFTELRTDSIHAKEISFDMADGKLQLGDNAVLTVTDGISHYGTLYTAEGVTITAPYIGKVDEELKEIRLYKNSTLNTDLIHAETIYLENQGKLILNSPNNDLTIHAKVVPLHNANTITANTDLAFMDMVGDEDTALGSLILAADKTLHLAGVKDINDENIAYANIAELKMPGDAQIHLHGKTTIIDKLNNTPTKGLISFYTNDITLTLGNHHELKSVNFYESATLIGGVNAITTTIAPDKVATFEGKYDGDEFDSKLNFTTAGSGSVIFEDLDSVTARDGGTSGNAIDFISTNYGHTTKLAGTFKATYITIDDQTLEPSENVTFEGAVTATDTTFDLAHDLTFAGGVQSAMIGGITIKPRLKANGEFKGIILSDVGTNIDVSGVNSTDIIIKDDGDVFDDNKFYPIFNTKQLQATKVAALNNITINDNYNKFTQWVEETVGDEVGLMRSSVAKNVITTELADSKGDVLAAALKFADENNTGDARATLNDQATMTKEKYIESIERLEENTAAATQSAVAQLSGTTGNIINARIAKLSSHNASSMAGMAAGEEDQPIYGAWATPFYSSTTQKELDGASGFASTAIGASVGFDLLANEDLTLGLAGSYAKTNMDHKDVKSGDKTKVDSFVLSLYAIQQLANDFFLQGQASFATNKVNSTQKHLTSTINESGTSQFSTSSYAAELLAGYDYNINNAVITPLIGANFTRINSAKYTEKGTTTQNQSVETEATNKLEAALGMKVQTTYAINTINITPEAHAFVKHDLIGKNGKITIKHSGMASDFLSKAAKNSQKTTINLGLGVNATSGMYEYGAGYDLDIANKLLSHQGTLKIRLNF